MIRLAITPAAYAAIAASLPKGYEARPPELLKTDDSGEVVGVWLDPRTVEALRVARGAGESYSEVILKLFEGDSTSKPTDVAVRLKVVRVKRMRPRRS